MGDLLISTVAALLAVSPAHAYWVMGCAKPIATERLDPIVTPGQIPSPHVHSIMGGTGFSANMTYGSTQTSKCTSCGVTKDLSNYWVPTVYFRASNGSFISVEQVGGTNVYYLQRQDWTETQNGSVIHPFPPDFRMVAGNPMLRSYTDTNEQRAVEFDCLLTDGEQGLSPFQGFPNRTCDGGLQIRVHFPSCWDGVQVDSADHKSHMAYPSRMDTGPCPATHPIRLMTLMYEMTWNVAAFDAYRIDGDQPFVFSFGDPTGFGYHGDFLNGWDVDVLAQAINDTDSCGDSAGGHVDKCKPFQPFLQDNDAQSQCGGVEPSVDEEVKGVLERLPGCNPVQEGPANALMQTC